MYPAVGEVQGFWEGLYCLVSGSLRKTLTSNGAFTDPLGKPCDCGVGKESLIMTTLSCLKDKKCPRDDSGFLC